MKSFLAYAENHIIGQSQIVKELSIYAEEVTNEGVVNILLQAPSGHGKTFLAKIFLGFVAGDEIIAVYTPDKNGEINFRKDRKFHFVDEAHKLTRQESLYHYMESEKYIFVFATNEFDKIKEPLSNRCYVLTLTPYKNIELGLMIFTFLRRKGYNIEFSWCMKLVPYTRGNPRELFQLVKRLHYLFKMNNNTPVTLDKIFIFLEQVLGIGKGGFTELDKQYISVLRSCGGSAGLNTLVNLTKIPGKIIQEEVEPFLIRKKLLQITPKGRKLI